jgi:hypothetical protein
MTKEERKKQASYCAMIIQHLSSAAELVLKDYEYHINFLGSDLKRETKNEVKRNAELAKKLRLSFAEMERKITIDASAESKDQFLDDVGFVYNIVMDSMRVAGDSDNRRARILKMINGLYKDKKIEM